MRGKWRIMGAFAVLTDGDEHETGSVNKGKEIVLFDAS
jgi:hypothetical protein